MFSTGASGSIRRSVLGDFGGTAGGASGLSSLGIIESASRLNVDIGKGRTDSSSGSRTDEARFKDFRSSPSGEGFGESLFGLPTVGVAKWLGSATDSSIFSSKASLLILVPGALFDLSWTGKRPGIVADHSQLQHSITIMDVRT